MISLLVIVSLVLPSVVGKCCLSDKISATVVEAGNYNPNFFLVDFSQKKFIFKPFDQAAVQFILSDFNDGNVYTMLSTGVCTITKLPLDPSTYDQCLTKARLIDTSYLGPEGVMEVDSYTVIQGDVQSTISVTKEGCHPVVSFSEEDGEVKTNFWLNVTTTVTDVSPLSVDTSNCVEEDEI